MNDTHIPSPVQVAHARETLRRARAPVLAMLRDAALGLGFVATISVALYAYGEGSYIDRRPAVAAREPERWPYPSSSGYTTVVSTLSRYSGADGTSQDLLTLAQ